MRAPSDARAVDISHLGKVHEDVALAGDRCQWDLAKFRGSLQVGASSKPDHVFLLPVDQADFRMEWPDLVLCEILDLVQRADSLLEY